jgi:hypothetical protein
MYPFRPVGQASSRSAHNITFEIAHIQRYNIGHLTQQGNADIVSLYEEGARMACTNRTVGTIVGLCVFCTLAANGIAMQTGIPDPALNLLSIGEPGPKRIGLQVWGDSEAADTLREGDRLTFTLQAEEDGYLTILGLSADGTATILFPNRKQPDNSIKGGMVETFFGDDSLVQLKLGGKVPGSWLVFYVNSKNMGVNWSKMGGGGQWVKIAPSSEKNTELLREALADMSKDERFNRVIVPVQTGSGQGLDLEPVEFVPPFGEKPLKRLPGTIDTKRPGTTTGTQGIREQRDND